MISLLPDQVRSLRMRAQGLHPRLSSRDAVRAVTGIQAQLSPAMMLALRARVRGLTVAEVEETINQSRDLVRTWAMRGTLHLLSAEDVRWLVLLLGPVFIPGGKGRRLQLGLDDEVEAKGLRAIQTILGRSGPLTRGELVEQLQEHAVELNRHSQAPDSPDRAGRAARYPLSWPGARKRRIDVYPAG